MWPVDSMAPGGQLAARSLLTRQPRPIEGMPRPVCERCPSFLPSGGGEAHEKGRWRLSVSKKGSWRDNLHKFISNLIMNHPGCWRRENTAQPACRRATLHICMSPPSFSPPPLSLSLSLTSMRRHSAPSPLPLSTADLTLEKECEQKKEEGRVLCRHRPPVSMAA